MLHVRSVSEDMKGLLNRVAKLYNAQRQGWTVEYRINGYPKYTLNFGDAQHTSNLIMMPAATFYILMPGRIDANPCPRCDNIKIEMEAHGARGWRMTCPSCGVSGPFAYTYSEAERLWGITERPSQEIKVE